MEDKYDPMTGKKIIKEENNKIEFTKLEFVALIIGVSIIGGLVLIVLGL